MRTCLLCHQCLGICFDSVIWLHYPNSLFCGEVGKHEATVCAQNYRIKSADTMSASSSIPASQSSSFSAMSSSSTSSLSTSAKPTVSSSSGSTSALVDTVAPVQAQARSIVESFTQLKAMSKEDQKEVLMQKGMLLLGKTQQ